MTKFSFRWGIQQLDDGFVPVYNFMLRNYAKAGLTRDEFLLIIHLASYHYESPSGKARPAQTTLADEMGYKHRNSVIRLIDSLRDKGMVITDGDTGFSLSYDFSPFSRRMWELYQDECTPQYAGGAHPSVQGGAHPSVHEEEEVKNKKEDSIATATPAPEKAPEHPTQPKPPTPYQAFTGAIAEHMFGIDISNKALVDASMGRIGPLASAIRKTHRALMQDDELTPTPEDVKEFVARWKAEQEGRKDPADVPMGANTVPPHWARLMAPNHKSNEYAGRGLIRSVDELRKVRSGT